jgi:hypothetical protein
MGNTTGFMGRNIRQDGLMRYSQEVKGNTRTYIVARIHASCGTYVHTERRFVTEVEGVIVSEEPMTDLHTLVRM